MKGPAVSIVMNAHNSTEFLAAALDSALAQTLEDLEVVLWDNASLDRAEQISASFNDPRIRYIYTPHKTSLYQARCDAVRICHGDYVAFLDCDDLWEPGKLEQQLTAMRSTGAVASCTDYQYFRDGSTTPPSYFRAYESNVVSIKDALLPYGVGMSCLAARRDILLEVLPDPVPDWFFIEDLDIVSRLLSRGNMAVVHEPLMSYRMHDSNASRDRGAYVREVYSWLEELETRAIDPRILRELNIYYTTQALRSQVAQLVSSGRRAEATRTWWQMPWTPTKVKWGFGLMMPRSTAARYA